MPTNVILSSYRVVTIVIGVLQTQASAIRMLQARIETVRRYLVDVQAGRARG